MVEQSSKIIASLSPIQKFRPRKQNKNITGKAKLYNGNRSGKKCFKEQVLPGNSINSSLLFSLMGWSDVGEEHLKYQIIKTRSRPYEQASQYDGPACLTCERGA
jgi:hypothetical protein